MIAFFTLGRKLAAATLGLDNIDISSVSPQEASVIGQRLGVKPGVVDAEQLRKGIEVEYEHTSDPGEAGRIALDHLRELPDYYTRLSRMEKGAATLRQNEGLSPLPFEPNFPTEQPRTAERRNIGHYTTSGVVSNPKVAAFPVGTAVRELIEELLVSGPRLLKPAPQPPVESKPK